MKGYIIDTVKGTHGEINCNGDLQSYCDAINCDYIDIAYRQIDGVGFDIVRNAEGLLRYNPVISAMDKNGNIMLVGSLLFFHHNDNGEFTSLSDEDIVLLKKHVHTYTHMTTGETIHVMVGVEY